MRCGALVRPLCGDDIQTMNLTNFLCVLLLVVVGGMIALAQPSRAAPVSQSETIRTPDGRRTYYMVRPARTVPNGTTYPIVVMLHGGYGNGKNMANATGIESYVAEDGFIAVFPNASRNHWNDGRSTTADGPDDVAFISRVVADVAERFGGDPARAFVAGMSNGGMLTHRLACEAPNAFRAFATVTANIPEDLYSACTPTVPVPIVMFAGTDDELMPYNGGAIPRSRLFGGKGGNVISAAATFEVYRTLDGCSGQTSSALPDTENDGTTVTRITGTGCSDELAVELYRIDGGGHTWPGSEGRRGPLARRMLGQTSYDIEATDIIVDFFRNYGL